MQRETFIYLSKNNYINHYNPNQENILRIILSLQAAFDVNRNR